jgi:hypothetical protein
LPIAELRNDRIELAAEYRERERVKEVPGAKWDPSVKTWWLPLSWAGCCQLRGVFGGDLRVGPELNAWAGREVTERISPCLELRHAADAPELEFFTALRPFQRAGVRFLVTARQALIADEMGLGKTIQAIAALEVIDAEERKSSSELER